VISAIDLFCGTGGLSLGLKQGGVRVVAGIDNAASCAYPYEENIKAKFVRKSVREVTGDELKRLWGRSSVRLLAGCAPCQPFSSQRRGVDTSQEQSWPLLLEFGRLVRETTPDYVTMENVPRLQKSEVFEEFVSILRETGYQVAHSVLFGPDYGLPQRRRRLVLLAGRGTDVPIPSPTVDKDSYRTVSDAIQDLPPLSAGEHDPDDRLHFARNLTPLNLRRIQASEPGGTWKDWPEELLLECQKKTPGPRSNRFMDVWNGTNPHRPSLRSPTIPAPGDSPTPSRTGR